MGRVRAKKKSDTASAVVVACDPGKHKLAFASVERFGTEWDSALLGGWTWHDAHKLLKSWMVPGSLFVCEGQYLGLNAKAAIDLASIRGGVEALALTLGYEVLPAVYPVSWQAGCGLRDGSPKRKELKLRAKAHAAAVTGWKGLDSDTADAVCMAAHAKGGHDQV